MSNEYPIIMKPSAFVRCPLVNCDLLNRELRYFIDQETLGIPLTLTIMQWISGNISRFKVEFQIIILKIIILYCNTANT